MTRIRWITTIVFVVVIAFGVLFAVNLGGDPTKVTNSTVGKTAPNFALKTFDGTQANLEKMRGKVVLVNFWNEWCAPCIEETPSLVALKKAHENDPGFEMVGIVHLANTQKAAKAYAAKTGMKYPLAFDPGSRTSLDYGVTGQPETFLIDKAGTVSKWYSGPVDPNAIEREIERLQAT